MAAESMHRNRFGGPLLARQAPLAMAFALLTLTSACKPTKSAEPASYAAGITGYNFTSEGVQEFYVNGQGGSNLPPYGGGGKTSCCVNVPTQWRPWLVAKIDWTMGRWTTPYESRKHLSPAAQVACCSADRKLSKTVPIERYGVEGGRLQVFFLPNDEIKVWVYDAGPQNPDHPSGMDYPKNPDPQEQ
jgi:hypothetical protein